MSRQPVQRPLSALLCLALVAGPLPVRADETIRCESRNFEYRYCRVDTDNRARLVRQFSSTDCREHRSWGYDRHGVWVDRGCGGEFRVGRGSSGSSDRAAVGAAVVGLAALAAIAASRQNQQSSNQDAEAWALGNFTGFDEFEGAQVTLDIHPGGNVTGRAGSNSFSGQLSGNLLRAGRHSFRIVRSGSGFIATDERNASHRVVFQRGYEGGY